MVYRANGETENPVQRFISIDPDGKAATNDDIQKAAKKAAEEKAEARAKQIGGGNGITTYLEYEGEPTKRGYGP